MALKRVRFFTGRLLSEDDFNTEQNYFIERMKRHNRLFHGSGVVCGLKVSVDSGGVWVGAGAAVDCEGNEIVLECPQSFALPGDNTTPQYLTLSYEEIEEDTVPSALNGEGEPSRIREWFKLTYETSDAFVGHGPKGRLKRACNGKHGVTLTRLRYAGARWRLV